VKSLEEMQQEVLKLCKDKGWYDVPVSFGELIALLHSEVSEALQAYRNHGLADATPGHQHTGPCRCIKTPVKPEGVGSEYADILIRLLDDAERHGIDMQAEYERKMAYNRTRPYRHGKKHY